MKKNFFKIIIAVWVIIITFSSCKEQGTSFISLRNISDNTMINIHNGYLKAKAKIDSVLFAGIHYAEIRGEIYDISDSLSIYSYGHCWSITNNDPLITNSSHTETSITEDTVSAQAKQFTYISKLYDLYLDTPYYVRSYVIFTDSKGNIIDTGYNPTVKIFRTRIPQDVWFKRANYDGDARSEAVSFTLGGDIYVGLGTDGISLLNDFWKYDPDAKAWTNIKGFPSPRKSAIAAVYNDTAVVGTGYSINGPERDMWRYDLFSNLWQLMDSLPGNCERYDAIAFTLTINGKQRVFVGAGYRNSPLNDFYMYKQEADTPGNIFTAWRSIPALPGPERTQAVVGVINNKAIVGLGLGSNNIYLKDFYIYDATEGTQGTWHYLTEAPITYGRANAVAFTLEFERNGFMNKLFFFATGRDELDTLYNDLWAYDLSQGKWYEKSDIREDFIVGEPREGAVGLSFERGHVEYGTLVRGLVGLGKSKNKQLKDFWEYLP